MLLLAEFNVQTKFAYIEQMLEHPSPSFKFPSSHGSPKLTPSPHISLHVTFADVVFVAS